MAGLCATSYTIHGIKLQFPCKAYPSQLSMMDKIIKGCERRQNCLLESPTGSGKSLALLCSALAWQAAEIDKLRQEDEDAKECCCKCENETEADSSHYFNAANQMPPPPSLTTEGGSTLSKSLGGMKDIEDLEPDDDFKTDARRFRTATGATNSKNGPLSSENPVGMGTATWTMEIQRQRSSEGQDGACCSCQCDDKPKRRKVPKIYFGTRTHKQIAQIIRELGKTAYKHVKMCILSSREHTCIDPEVSTMPKKNEECKNKLDGPGCRYNDRVRKISHRSIRDHGLDSAWDLEEFVGFCKKAKACPYFGARLLKDGAEIIFCPYNYLVDPLVRQSMEITLADQVVILDEAHNIEDSARDAASFSVSQKSLVDSIQDLDNLVDQRVKPAEHSTLRNMCKSVNQFIDQNAGHLDGDDYNQTSRVWTGMDMVAQLELLGIGPKNFDQLTKCYQAVSEDDISEKGKREGSLKAKTNPTLQTLSGLLMVLGYIYADNMKFMEDYRVVIVKTMTYFDRPTDGRWLSKKRKGHREVGWTLTLNFWCLNPAVAFSDIGRHARCVVLTSGTLSPMTSFQSELGVPFPIQLEANHVITPSQVWVGTISKGPRGGSLLGSYQTAETWGYQDEVGDLLLNVCQTVPHGVLCFLPSYKSLEKLSNRWKSTGLWEKMLEHKVVMSEPRAADKVDFDELMKSFYQVIAESENADVSSGGVTGALFLAVCRGKVSEGLDFADNNARAVITVGIPYPNFKDTQIGLKQQYNDQHSSSKGLLRGRDWYEIQAYRAVNQALGRCIRHRHDWGALLLVDERFGKNPQRYIKGLSKWVRQRVQYYSTFQQANLSLSQFTQSRLSIAHMTDINHSVTAVDSPNRSLGSTPGAPLPLNRSLGSTPAAPLPLHPFFKIPAAAATVPGASHTHSPQSVTLTSGEVDIENLRCLDTGIVPAARRLSSPSVSASRAAAPSTSSSLSHPPPTAAAAATATVENLPLDHSYVRFSQAGGFLPSQAELASSTTRGRLNGSAPVGITATQADPTLAGSDDGDRVDDMDISSFRPPFASTQAVPMATSHTRVVAGSSARNTPVRNDCGAVPTKQGREPASDATSGNQGIRTPNEKLNFGTPATAVKNVERTKQSGGLKDKLNMFKFMGDDSKRNKTQQRPSTGLYQFVSVSDSKSLNEPEIGSPAASKVGKSSRMVAAEGERSSPSLFDEEDEVDDGGSAPLEFDEGQLDGVLKELGGDGTNTVLGVPKGKLTRTPLTFMHGGDPVRAASSSPATGKLNSQRSGDKRRSKDGVCQDREKYADPDWEAPGRKPLFSKNSCQTPTGRRSHCAAEPTVGSAKDAAQSVATAASSSPGKRRLSRGRLSRKRTSSSSASLDPPADTKALGSGTAEQNDAAEVIGVKGGSGTGEQNDAAEVIGVKGGSGTGEQNDAAEVIGVKGAAGGGTATSSSHGLLGPAEEQTKLSDIANIMHLDREEAEPEAGDGQVLNTRRSKRRRNTKVTPSKRLKTRGVEFIDNVEDAKGALNVVSCPQCGCRFVETPDLTRETFRPAFLKHLSARRVCRSDISAVTVDAVLTSGLTVIHTQHNGFPLNSHWSGKDDCCVQFLACANCSPSYQQGQGQSQADETDFIWVGAEVKSLNKDHSPRLKAGQVWFLPHCVQSSSL